MGREAALSVLGEAEPWKVDLIALLELAWSFDDDNYLAEAYHRQAIFGVRTANRQVEESATQEALKAAQRCGNEPLEIKTLSLKMQIGKYLDEKTITIRNIEEALSRARRLGDESVLAYDLMQLGETYYAIGDLRKAHLLAEQSLEEIAISADARGKTIALNLLGIVLLAEGDVYSAARRFAEGREIALSQGLTPLLHESITGLAACAAMEGRLDEARQYITEVWDYLKEHGWVGMNIPSLVYRTCAEIFDTLGEAENVLAAIESGHQLLMDVADKINVPAWRQAFYVILEGEVKIVKALGTSDERFLGKHSSGEILGEMSLFSQGRNHTASVRACTPVKALEITRTDIDVLIKRQPKFAYELVGLISNRLERDLEIARQIQLSILPHSLPAHLRYNFGARMVPARAVGGDFYGFIWLDDSRLGLWVGDVAGKSVPAALGMTMTCSLVQAEAHRASSPGATLQAVNRLLLELDITRFYVTLLYGVLDCSTGQFSYARAGHPFPVILDKRGLPIEVPTGLGQALGLFDDPCFDEQCLNLPPGGMLLVYTDGLSEAVDAQGRDFSLDLLQAAVSTAWPAGAQAACDRAWQAVQAFTGALPQQDDFLILAIGRSIL